MSMHGRYVRQGLVESVHRALSLHFSGGDPGEVATQAAGAVLAAHAKVAVDETIDALRANPAWARTLGIGEPHA